MPRGESALIVPEDTKIVQRRNTDPRPAGRGRPDAESPGTTTARPTSRRRRRSRSSLHRRRRRAGSRRTSCGRSATSWRASCAARTPSHVRRARAGGLRVITTLDLELQASPRSGSSSAARVPQRKDPRGGRRAARLRRVPGLGAQPRGQERPQRRPRRHRLPDRRAHRLRRLGATTTRRAGSHEFQPQFDVLEPGLPPAGLGVQAVQLRRRHRRPRRSPPARCSWTARPTSAAATRRATPTTSSAVRSGSATPCSSR